MKKTAIGRDFDGATDRVKETMWETLGRAYLRYQQGPERYADEFTAALLPVLREGVRCERARMVLPSHHDEDWVQDLMHKVVGKGSLLKLPNPPTSLSAAAGVLHTILRRDIWQCAKQARKRSKRFVSFEAVLEASCGREVLSHDAADIHGWSPFSPKPTTPQELSAEVVDLISALQLSAEERGPFQLCLVEGRGQAEAGMILCRSQGEISKILRTIRARAHRLAHVQRSQRMSPSTHEAEAVVPSGKTSKLQARCCPRNASGEPEAPRRECQRDGQL